MPKPDPRVAHELTAAADRALRVLAAGANCTPQELLDYMVREGSLRAARAQGTSLPAVWRRAKADPPVAT